MTKKSNLEDLMGAVESIRGEKYSDLPAELLEALLIVEYENQDNRVNAQTEYMKMLDEYFNKLVD